MCMPKGDEGSSDQTKTVFYQHLAPPAPMNVTVGVNIFALSSPKATRC